MENNGTSSNSSESNEAKAGYSLGSAKFEPIITPAVDLEPGTQIDDFLILNKVGPGGFGVVYKALQKSVNREVAVKVILPEKDTQAVIERFNLEKKTLGSLNHPNNVNVIAGGTFKGQPYFAMEYVDGMPITNFADKFSYSVQQRLELFQQVCEAVKYAHDRGVIHRDLKPRNILVKAKSGEDPQVKVIDFGIAKVINIGLPSAYATQAGMGTPGYMSPEQAGDDPEAVGESTDIYALGVLLYELLVGKLPVEISGGGKNYLKCIREQLPLPPSKRINEKDDSGYFQVANKRGVDPAQLEKLIAGDLDRITIKCLEKNPARRYESVSHLETEISQWMNKNIVATGPVSSSTNFSKRVVITSIALVILIVAAVEFSKNHNATPTSITGSLPTPTAQAATKVLDPNQPEDLWQLMLETYAGQQKDISFLQAHQTVTGKQVWDWLIQQNWLKTKGTGRTIEPLKIGKDGRQELIKLYDSPDGTEKISLVFYSENGVLKFHDIYLFTMKGDTFEMFLSYCIREPIKAKLLFASNNPGKVLKGVLDIFK